MNIFINGLKVLLVAFLALLFIGFIFLIHIVAYNLYVSGNYSGAILGLFAVIIDLAIILFTSYYIRDSA